LLGSRRVEAFHRFGGEIESGLGPDEAGVLRAEKHAQVLLLRHLLQHRKQLLLKLVLQGALHLLHFLHRLLLERLLLLRRLLRRRFSLLLLDQLGDLRVRGLAVSAVRREVLQVHVGDLRARRERGGRRRRDDGGRGGRGRRRGCRLRRLLRGDGRGGEGNRGERECGFHRFSFPVASCFYLFTRICWTPFASRYSRLS